MAQPAPARPKINTKSTQAWDVPGSGRPGRRARASARVRGEARESARGRAVIELEAGITVYPPQEAGSRWRAVWTEDGRRRYCEAVTEEKLANKLAKVTERLEADAPGMERLGSDLIAWYLSPDRLPAGEVTGPDAPALLADCEIAYGQASRSAHVTGGKPLGTVDVTEAAFRWVTYTPAAATLELVSAGPDGQGNTVRASTQIGVVWDGRDWKVIAPPGGDWGNAATEISSLAGYTLFSGQGGGR